MTQEPLIAVVRPSLSDGDAAYLCRGILTTLRHVGLPAGKWTEQQIAAGALTRGPRLALLPCNPALPPPALAALLEWVRRGGKLLLGFNPPSELLARLGLKRLRLRPAVAREMVFTHKAVHALPPRLFLSTRQIVLFQAGPQTRAIAQWYSLQDLTLREPAAYLAADGALLTTAFAETGERTQFSEDRLHLGRFLAALVNHFVPGFDLLQFQRRLTEQQEREEQLVREARPRAVEVRGLWLPHVPTSEDCARAARWHFNLLCADLGPLPAHQYERRVFHRPWAEGRALSECLEAAHRHGLALFPWIRAWALPPGELEGFFGGTGRLLEGGQPQSARWMCPTHPDNQQLLLEAVHALLEECGVDGVVVAGLRFPGPTACMCDGCAGRFQSWCERKLGARLLNRSQQETVWNTWREEVLTDLLQRLLTTCRAANPHAKLGVACMPAWDKAGKEFGQRAGLWAQQGWADLLVPLNFTDEPETLRQELDHQLAHRGGGTALCPGLGLYTSVSELASGAELIRQIELARERGADGFLLWHAVPTLFDPPFGEALAAGAMAAPARLPWQVGAAVAREIQADSAKLRRPRHRSPWPVEEG